MLMLLLLCGCLPLLEAQPHRMIELRERLCGNNDGNPILAGHL
jgi:hypothetical protein